MPGKRVAPCGAVFSWFQARGIAKMRAAAGKKCPVFGAQCPVPRNGASVRPMRIPVLGARETARWSRRATGNLALGTGHLPFYPAAVSLITSSSVVIPRFAFTIPSMRSVSIPSEMACFCRSAVEASCRIIRRSVGDIAITS